MALIKCPDCQKDVSDKAEKCPFCGCPINPSITNSPSETSAISYSYSKNIVIMVRFRQAR